MGAYNCMSHDALVQELEKLQKEYVKCKEKGMNLNISRGKPSKAQLDLVNDFFDVLTSSSDFTSDGIEIRNYGELSGIPAAKRLWADILGCRPEQVFVGGASSLTLMYDVISKAYTHGLRNSERPWSKENCVKFLCPSPGYDRHFRITESFGAELISIPMTSSGPDMDMVEEYVKDPAVKGIWCVPKYSNPEGIIYSQETIERFANLSPAARDFVIMWDNAYCVHEFEGEYIPFPDIISMCEKNGKPDMVMEFASTSKITFPGSGISCMAASKENIGYFSKLMGVQMISFNKVNQLAHVRYLKDKENTLALMKRHSQIMGPKFRVVSDYLEREIRPCGFAEWNRPTGGYFVSLNTMPGTAKRALSLCEEAGLTMTPAGATFPYGIDPNDRNIRIAPSFPPVEELEEAMQVFCLCLKIAALEKLVG